MAKFLDLEGLNYFWAKIKSWVLERFAYKSDLNQKLNVLISSQNIKTLNNESILGSGNIEIQGGGNVNSVNGKTGDVVLSASDVNALPSSTTIPTKVSDLTNDSGFITGYTETDPTVPSWAKQQNKPSYQYSEIGNTPDLSGFITKSVNDLTNYYLKSETYTKAEVQALIGAIQNFHYEFYASTSAVTNPQGNVLYLIGPTGTGSDKYEEYVYSNNAFTKIGDTSIDLSGYVTTSALNTALADYVSSSDLATALSAYTPTSNLATVATSGSYNDLDDKPTIPDTSDFEAFANKVSTIAGNETNTTKYPNTKAVADALGKWGVISQTQTWSGTGTQPRTYVMSDLVYGIIPQANIDLFESAGATFNTTSGYFELNGLNDISYEEMKEIYRVSSVCFQSIINRNYTFAESTARTNFPLKVCSYVGYTTTMPNMFYASNTEIIAFSLTNAITPQAGNIGSCFNGANKVKNIIGVLKLKNQTAIDWSVFYNTYSLESINISSIKANIEFKQSSLLSLASVVYMVENAINTTAITITLHADALARCTADTTEYEYNDNTYTGIVALATAKNITLASA